MKRVLLYTCLIIAIANVQRSSFAFDPQLLLAQHVWSQLGFYEGRPDGIYGPKTRAAAGAFQKKAGLPVTGQADPLTLFATLQSQALNICQQQIGVEITECLSYLALQLNFGKSKRHEDSPCDAAYNECVLGCESSTVYDYYYKRHIENSDFTSSCEVACDEGRTSCERRDPQEDIDYACRGFASDCEGSCPTGVHDYAIDVYIDNTDAEDICANACDDGKRQCASFW